MTTKAVEFEAWALWSDGLGGFATFTDGRVDIHNEQGAMALADVYPVRPVRVRVTVQPIEPAPTGDK